MTVVDFLAGGLIVPLVINWLTLGVVVNVERRNPGIPTLTDRRWLALGIAIMSTAFAVLAVSYFTRISFGAVPNAVLLVVPVYALTAVDVVFLYRTMKGKW